MKNKVIKFFTYFLGIITIINALILLVSEISYKIKIKKQIYKDIKFVKEYELSVPKNISKKEVNELIKEIIETENEKSDYKASAYAWKNKNTNEVYKLKKINK